MNKSKNQTMASDKVLHSSGEIAAPYKKMRGLHWEQRLSSEIKSSR
jgi:hypothetical protein